MSPPSEGKIAEDSERCQSVKEESDGEFLEYESESEYSGTHDTQDGNFEMEQVGSESGTDGAASDSECDIPEADDERVVGEDETPDARVVRGTQRHFNDTMCKKIARVRVQGVVRKIEFYCNDQTHIYWLKSADGTAAFTLREAILGHPYMDLQHRIGMLSADPDVRQLTETDCVCRGCRSTIRLSLNRTTFAVFLWIIHMANCTSLQELLTSEYPHATTFTPSHSHQKRAKQSTEMKSNTIKCHGSSQRPKKQNRTRQENRELLQSDPLLGVVESHRVFCELCNKWLSLGRMREYSPHHWWDHRRRLHRDVPGGAQLSDLRKKQDNRSASTGNRQCAPKGRQRPRNDRNDDAEFRLTPNMTETEVKDS